jgi:hypothetical protein
VFECAVVVQDVMGSRGFIKVKLCRVDEQHQVPLKPPQLLRCRYSCVLLLAYSRCRRLGFLIHMLFMMISVCALVASWTPVHALSCNGHAVLLCLLQLSADMVHVPLLCWACSVHARAVEAGFSRK